MGGGGGKGDSEETTINKQLAAASEPMIARATELSKTGYTPNRGVQFAAFTPMQEAAFANNNNTMKAFGRQGVDNPMAGMPEATMGEAGILGYGTGSAYDDNINASMSPEEKARRDAAFIDPFQTGDNGQQVAGPVQAAPERKWGINPEKRWGGNPEYEAYKKQQQYGG